MTSTGPPQESYGDLERWRRVALGFFAGVMGLIAIVTLVATPMPGAKHGLSKVFSIAIAIPATGLPGAYAIWALSEHVQRPARDVLAGALMGIYLIGAAVALSMAG